MNEIIHSGRSIGHVSVRIQDERPKLPITATAHGYRLLSEDQDEYYRSRFNLHRAVSVDIMAIDPAIDGSRDYPSGRSGPNSFRKKHPAVEIRFSKVAPYELPEQMMEDNSDSLLLNIVPLVRRTVLEELARHASRSSDDLHIDKQAEQDMLDLGLPIPRPTRPVLREWSAAPAPRRQATHSPGVRAVSPALLGNDENLNLPNLATAQAMVEFTSHTPVAESKRISKNTRSLPTAVLREVNCTVEGRHVPASMIDRHTLAENITLLIDLHSARGTETIETTARYFTEGSRPQYTARGRTLIIARDHLPDNPEEAIEELLADIRVALPQRQEDDYRIALMHMLMRPDQTSEAALRHIVGRGMSHLTTSAGEIRDAIEPGATIRAGDYLITYDPERSDG